MKDIKRWNIKGTVFKSTNIWKSTHYADWVSWSSGIVKRKKEKKKQKTNLEPSLRFCHLVGDECAQISIVHDRDMQN